MSMRNTKKRLNNKKNGGAFGWPFGKKKTPNRSIDEIHKDHKKKSSIEGVSQEEATQLLENQARRNVARHTKQARIEASRELPPPMNPMSTNPMHTNPYTGGKKKRKSMKLKKKSMRTRKGKGVKSRKYKK